VNGSMKKPKGQRGNSLRESRVGDDSMLGSMNRNKLNENNYGG